MELYRTLSPEEEVDFKKWARDNFNPVDDLINQVWHPVVKGECLTMCKEFIMEHPEYLCTRGMLDYLVQMTIPNGIVRDFEKAFPNLNLFRVFTYNAEANALIPEFKREQE